MFTLIIVLVFVSIIIFTLLALAFRKVNVLSKIGSGILIHSLLLLLVKLHLERVESLPKISIEDLLFFAICLVYLTSSIGLLKHKNWGRVLGVCATSIMAVLSFGYWLYIGYSDYANPTWIDSPGAGFVFGLTVLIIPIFLPSLIFLIILTRPKVKALFSPP